MSLNLLLEKLIDSTKKVVTLEAKMFLLFI